MLRTVLTLCLSASVLGAADIPQGVQHVPNFDKVNDHIYRGGQPTSVGLQELGAMGIKRVIDLRQNGEAEQTEERQLRDLKITYVHVPMAELRAPTETQVEQVLKLLNDHGDAPIFVHCRRGKDRTGTVIACYRIQHDGWTNQHALEEAKEHGMSSFERGMRSFVLHFTPQEPGLLGLTPTAPSTPLLH